MYRALTAAFPRRYLGVGAAHARNAYVRLTHTAASKPGTSSAFKNASSAEAAADASQTAQIPTAL